MHRPADPGMIPVAKEALDDTDQWLTEVQRGLELLQSYLADEARTDLTTAFLFDAIDDKLVKIEGRLETVWTAYGYKGVA